VPLDPGDPTDWVVETAAAAAVDALVVDRMAPWLNFLDRRVRVLESGELLITGDTAAGETDPIGRDDPAMLVCTSGSTGDPKAVLLTNGNLLSYHAALLHAVGVNADDRYLHAASVSFSSANRQLLLPLLTGAAVVLSSPEQRADIEQLIALIEDCRVTVLDLVPTQLEMVAEAINRGTGRSHFDELRNSVRLTLTASEALTGGIVEKWRSIMGVTHPIINEAYS
jgi:non-ribosomal peptide synthetase component F